MVMMAQALSNGRMMGTGYHQQHQQSANVQMLLKQISQERSPKDARLHACNDFQKLVLSMDGNVGMRGLGKDAFDILYQLDELFFTRMAIEVKRAIAVCIGAIGYTMTFKYKDYVNWVFKNVEQTTDKQDVKVLYLRALAATLNFDKQNRVLDDSCISKTMSDVQRTLEENDSPVVLIALLDLATIIACNYKQIFAPHFKDVIDIVAGWYIDTEQSMDVLNKCEATVKALQPFWLDNIDFCIDILSQFLEDAEGYMEESKQKRSSSETTIEDCLLKCSVLLRAHKVILGTISDCFMVSNATPPYLKFAESALSKTVTCIESVLAVELAEANDVLAAAVGCLQVLLSVCRLKLDMIVPVVVQLVPKLCLCSKLEQETLLEVLALVKQIVGQLPPETMAHYVDNLIGSEGCLKSVRFHPNRDVSATTMSVYKSLVFPRGITCLTRVYRNLLVELLLCLKAMGPPNVLESISFGSDVGAAGPDIVDSHLAEWIFVFDMTILMDLGSAKNSLLAMLGLSPSVFDLFSRRMPLLTDWFSSQWPAAHYSVLFALKCHCDKHEQFVSNCEWLVNSNRTPMLSNAQTSKHLVAVLDLLIKLLKLPSLCPETRRLCVCWVHELVQLTVKLAKTLLSRPEFVLLLEALLQSAQIQGHELPEIHVDAIKHLLLSMGSVSQTVWDRLISTCAILASQKGQYLFLSILEKVPMVQIFNCVINPAVLNQKQLPAQNTFGLGTLTTEHFRVMSDFLLERIAPTLIAEESNERLWCESIALIRSECIPLESFNESLFKQPTKLWQWAVWTTAQFCVGSRLKTHFGKPVDTFTALETEIRALLTETVKGSARKAPKTETEDSTEEVIVRVGDEPHLCWFRVRALLSFMECLDKQMYNAYEGTACALTNLSVSKEAKKFFRTNRKTCQHWVDRNRLPLMAVALQNQNYAMVLRLANDTLLSWATLDNKIKANAQTELLLMLTAEAMYKLGCSQSLVGLYEWCKQYMETRYVWLKSFADVALGRYEPAVASISAYLNESKSTEETDGENGQKSTVSTAVRRFLSNQMLECYFNLRDWQSAKKWIEEATANEELSTENGSAQLFKDKDLSYLRALGRFENEENATTDSGTLAWNAEDQGRLFERKLMNLTEREESTERRRMARELTAQLRSVQKVRFWMDWPQLYPANLELSKRLLQTLIASEKSMQPDLRLSSFLNSTAKQPATRQSIANSLGFWSDRIRIKLGDDFDLQASRLARKNKNYDLSVRFLLKHASQSAPTDMDPVLSINSIFADVSGTERLDAKWLPMARHSAKLLFGLGHTTQGFALLSNSVAHTLESVVGSVVTSGVNESLLDIVCRRLAEMTIMSSLSMEQMGAVIQSQKVDDLLREEMSRSLLSLAQWMQNNMELGEIFFQNEESVFVKLIEEQLNYAEHSLGAIDHESVVGALLTMSAYVCPEFIKAQRTLADWAYRAGKKAVEGSSRDEHVVLTQPEQQMLSAALPPDATSAERDAVFGLVSSLRTDDGGVSSAEQLLNELQAACDRLSYADTLVDIWQNANKRLFTFYNAAAKAYFQFLRFSSEDSITTVTATLRLLRLLVKHISLLDPTLQDEFENTNALAWQTVMPQLFARLNHPSTVVRETLCRLLERMAVAAPHLVCFPALIGLQGGTALPQDTVLFAPDENEEIEEEEAGIDSDAQSLMESCCDRLVDVLKTQDEKMVEDTNVFICELQRITLLREEKWLSVLGYLQHDIAKRFRQLEEETSKTMKIEHLSLSEKEDIIKDKTVIYTRMVFKTLEDLYERTCLAETETPNEQLFVSQYSSVIAGALAQYGSHPTLPQQSWEPFAQLLAVLHQRSAKRLSLNLDMQQISPILAGFSQTRVPMPGQGAKATNQLVTVSRIEHSVNILSTKTRPKKLSFVGSDGKTYQFLFKGLEDLHLDERIMQFLQVCNLMLANKNDERANYFARNYSVTPLGVRSGLIQWVDNAPAMFMLYRRWQMREAQAISPTAHVPRPSELYTEKLNAILRDKGIKHDPENRHRYSVSVLRQVLKDLLAETPNDLLAKEIWCRCPNPDVWWTLTERFSRSCAVMSMIGYVIGLGDRHLDNVLVDLDSGDVVHIDYNICFEKGKHLRIPETVPFRMTANMQTALGPTGVEGVFRLSCEDVLRVLRAGRETLLTLLEAFVYDPLVDWAATHEMGAANVIGPAVMLTVYGTQKQDSGGSKLATQLACKMFSVRRKELSIPWATNEKVLESALQQATENLARVAAIQDELAKLQEKQRNLEEEAVLTQVTSDDFALPDTEHIKKELCQIESQQIALREQMALITPLVVRFTQEVKNALSSHHRMMLDMRLILKSMAKMEEHLGHKNDGPFNMYLSLYKENFVEPLAACLRILTEGSDWSPEQVRLALRGMSVVLASIRQVYEMLLELDAERSREEEWPSLGAEPQEPKQLIPPSLLAESAPKTQHGREERNAHGMAIWRRVRFKLEGRDPDQNVRSSVQEQVSNVLSEATSVDKLSLMYEGWTAWV